MKTIGLIGGISWHSSAEYYRLFNQLVNEARGGVSSAKVIINSVDYADIKRLTEAGDWKSISQIVCTAAQKMEMAGADCILVGANTMHKLADDIQAAVHVPFIHIAEATADSICLQHIQTVALLGTKYVMQQDFYKEKLSAKGITTLIPEQPEVDYINHVIYEEFGKGQFLPETKKRFLQVIDKLIGQGAGGIIAGCTEIPLLIKQDDCSVPVFDTTLIHARAAVKFALS